MSRKCQIDWLRYSWHPKGETILYLVAGDYDQALYDTLISRSLEVVCLVMTTSGIC